MSLTTRPDDADDAAGVPLMQLRTQRPFRLDLTAWALRRRAGNRVDVWDGSYRRAVNVGDRTVSVRVEQHCDRPVLHVSTTDGQHCTATESASIGSQLRWMLGLDVDLTEFYRLADADPRTAALKDCFVGVRPPRFPSLFESFVNAIANQQLSVDAGIASLNRFADAYGDRTPDGRVGFLRPATVVGASPDDLRALGFSYRKAEYIVAAAQSVLTGELDRERLTTMDRAPLLQSLTRQHGIGRWSAEYVMLRGLGRIDVFPGDDVGARNNLQRFMDLAEPPSYTDIAEMLAPWTPAAGMLYFHLLLKNLDARGELQR